MLAATRAKGHEADESGEVVLFPVPGRGGPVRDDSDGNGCGHDPPPPYDHPQDEAREARHEEQHRPSLRSLDASADAVERVERLADPHGLAHEDRRVALRVAARLRLAQ